MPADAAFGRSPSRIVPHAKGMKYPRGTVVHLHWKSDSYLVHRPAKKLMSRGIKPEPFRGMVELLLSDLEGVELFIHVELQRSGTGIYLGKSG